MINTVHATLLNLGAGSSTADRLCTHIVLVGLVTSIIIFLLLLKVIVRGIWIYVWCQLPLARTDYRTRYGAWAVISGSTDGIGLGMARELARRGHSIVLMGRNEKKLAEAKASVEKEPHVGDVIAVLSDLSDARPENYAQIKRQIDPDNRDIGILINNAGVGPNGLRFFEEIDPTIMHAAINVGIVSNIYLTQMIIPGMVKRQRGLIVNVSSFFGCIDGPYGGTYGPIKSFVSALGRQLKFESSFRSGIDVVNLHTGAVGTKLLLTHMGGKLLENLSLIQTPEAYAKSALNAISSRTSSMAGHISHALSLNMLILLNHLDLASSALFRLYRFIGNDQVGYNRIVGLRKKAS